jgi:hypothetical protein
MLEVTAELLASRQHVADLQAAMEKRSAIDSACGVLMAQNQCSHDEAFDLLRRPSNTRNQKLNEVALGILDGFPRGFRNEPFLPLAHQGTQWENGSWTRVQRKHAVTVPGRHQCRWYRHITLLRSRCSQWVNAARPPKPNSLSGCAMTGQQANHKGSPRPASNRPPNTRQPARAAQGPA